jgi:hypothetical protein
MATYTTQEFHTGVRAEAVSLKDLDELETALDNIDAGLVSINTESTANAALLADINSVTAAAAATAAAITDNTTGTASQTLAAGAGVHTISIPMDLANITDGDVLTDYTPGYKFKLLAVDFAVGTPVTTAAKATTLNLDIGATPTTGGTVALTSANCTPLGAVVAGAAITAANTGSASDTISVVAASTTQFVEGDGYLLVKIQNMDTADAIASITDDYGKLLTDVGLIRTAVNAVITAAA